MNNAGVNKRGPIEELTEADWDMVIDTNLKGPWLCRARGGAGHARSRVGTRHQPRVGARGDCDAGRSPYASSKSGVINLTRVLALEWAGTGVTANAICPGAFGTEMNRVLLDDPVKYQEFVRRIPMKRWGEVEEIAGAAVFLASDAASYVTGSTLTVDGGWTAT